MELLIISIYTAICIAVFTVFRIPLNRWTMPTASIGGIVLIFALIQLLNYFHPYSGTSQQYLTTAPITPNVIGQVSAVPPARKGHSLVAWFHQNNRPRLNDASAAEVTFESIPGKVFSGKVQMVIPTLGEDHAWAEDSIFDPPTALSQTRIPVMISITDPRYANYAAQIPGGAHAQTAIYGEQLQHLALVRKTLLRMSAWMNYLSLPT